MNSTASDVSFLFGESELMMLKNHDTHNKNKSASLIETISK